MAVFTKTTISIIIASFLFSGCSATINQIGGRSWYNKRTTEIEEALKNGEISKAEYLSLKNQTEDIRYKWLNPTHQPSHIYVTPTQ